MEQEKIKVDLGWLLRAMTSVDDVKRVLDQFENNSEIEIETLYKEALTEEETKILASFSNGLQEKGCTCKFEDGYTIPQAIEASRRLNSWVEEIKNARVDGRELTNFEKYVYAYEIVTDFVYNAEKEGEDWKSSRKFARILTGDKIVCVGYATLLQEMLQRLGIPCAYVHLSGKDGEAGHAACAVFIKDEKYGLQNVLFSDPTFGSRGKYPKDFQYMIMPKEMIDRIWGKFGIDFKEILKDLMDSSYDINGNTNLPDIQKLFENAMENNKYDQLISLDAIKKVFQAQGLSLDAAFVVSSARFWGKSVSEILEIAETIGMKNEQTEKELSDFAKNKKDHSKKDEDKTENVGLQRM